MDVISNLAVPTHSDWWCNLPTGKKRKKARTQKSRGKTGLWLGSKVGEKSTRKRRRKTRRRKGAKKVVSNVDSVGCDFADFPSENQCDISFCVFN